MSDLTPGRIAELRRIAEAATPGPWAANPWQAVVDEMETLTPICGMLWPTELRTEEQTLANAQHIAAFDPTTALELLDALAAARAEAERWKTTALEWLDELTTARAEAERWRRRHDALRAAVIKAEADYASRADGLDDALMILRQLLAEAGR